MRRILAVHFPFLRIELARAAMQDTETALAPLALVISGVKRDGAVRDERSLLGNTRLDEVSVEAWAAGIRPRDTIASARARSADLRVRVVPIDAVVHVLERMAETLLAFGATTSIDVATNGLWVDVTGCAHLHGEGTVGERALVSKVAAVLRAMNHTVRVAIADGAFVARAMARFGSEERPLVLVPQGANARALASLPLVALDLDEDTIHWLNRLGVARIEDLQKLPPKALGTRLGKDAPRVLALLRGDDPRPLVPHVPKEHPEEPASFEYGVESTEALLFVVKRLCDAMAQRLSGRGLGITVLHVVLKLDRAFVSDRPEETLSFSLSAPITESADMLSIVRARFESLTLSAPVLGLTLRAHETQKLDSVQKHLFVPEAKALRKLPRLAAELEAELGPLRVGVLALTNRWCPGDRSPLVSVTAATAHAARLSSPRPHALPLPEPRRPPLLTGSNEPTRLLREPILLTRSERNREHEASQGARELLVRLEAVEWWNRGLEARVFESMWVASFETFAFVEIAQGERWIRGSMDG